MGVNRDELVETWLREERQPFVGWDFSYLDGRIKRGREPWSYLGRAAELMDRSSSVIDLDTGGGEKLLSLRDHWPARVVATEDFAPNFELVCKRLSPLGVEVVKAAVGDTDPMPFADNEFDLVLNRHADFNSREVARVLSPGGTFLTQQVHGMWLWDLQASFDATPEFPDATPKKYVPVLREAGLTIVDVQEWEGRMVFEDVGAIVYYLKAIPWEVPGFTVKSHLRYLLTLQERLEAGEELGFFAARYLIAARKAGR
ncbi:MAG: methyltransferase domain-containing protein [Chloroflexota bacterium]|nr:methyltransferase domain-containing protein [Chloroflexota bacterium]